MSDIFSPKPDATLAADMAKTNPANEPQRAPTRRVPMSLPTLKLELPPIPGYVCHWFRGTAQRLEQANRAGYQFVTRDEVAINSYGLANDYNGDGNSDLGSRVSVASGNDSEDAGVRLYLMKIKREYWNEDQLAIDQRHEQIASTLRGDKGLVEAGMDSSNRYSRGEQRRHMFHPKPRSA